MSENGRFWGSVLPLSWGQERGRDRRPNCAEPCGKGRRNGGRREFTLSASLSTAGAEDPLPIVRLPARNPYRTPPKKSLESRAVSYSAMPYYHCIYGAWTGRTRKSSSPARGPSVTLIEPPRSRALLTRLEKCLLHKTPPQRVNRARDIFSLGETGNGPDVSSIADPNASRLAPHSFANPTRPTRNDLLTAHQQEHRLHAGCGGVRK